jgi:polyhydroxyalkanoate synthase
VTRYLPRAAKAIQRTTGAKQMTVLGYCIGGALATCFTALHPEVVRNLVLLTAPLDFADSGQFGRMTARGVFPIDLLTDTFPTVPGQMPDVGSKLLNPMANYVGTYRNLWQRLGDPSFDVGAWQAMYRWVNDSVPLAGAAFRQWIVEFYQDNRLSRDMLEMDGRPVRLAAIRCPVLNIAASRDAIAPRATTSIVTKRVGSKDASEIIVEGGHVGIVVGRSASQNLWPKVGAWLNAHD